MITLTHPQAGTIELNEHLVWRDEGKWLEMAQSQDFSLAGSVIAQVSRKLAGMPITLNAAGNEGLKYRRDVIPLIRLVNEYMADVFVLKIHDDRKFNVIWRATDGAPVEFENLIPYADPEDSDYIELTLRFTVV